MSVSTRCLVGALAQVCTTSSHPDPPGYAPSADPLSPSSPSLETGRRRDPQKGNSYTLKLDDARKVIEVRRSSVWSTLGERAVLWKVAERCVEFLDAVEACSPQLVDASPPSDRYNLSASISTITPQAAHSSRPMNGWTSYCAASVWNLPRLHAG